MSGPSRTALVQGNESLMELLCAKRDNILAEAQVLSEKGEEKHADGKRKYVSTIDKALSSLCDHRTAITTRQEVNKLKHVGPWILRILEPFFEERNGAPTEQPASQESSDANGRPKRKYIPKRNSAGFALLITLLRAYQNGKQFMMKQELIDEADKSGLSSKPIRDNGVGWTAGRPNASNMYSGWSSMSTLIQKSLVVKSSNPAKYKLTDEGKSLAQQCMDKAGLTVDNCPAHEIAREEERRVSPAPQESGKFGSQTQASSSSDDDVQEIGKFDPNSHDKRRRRDNSHIPNSATTVGVSDRTPLSKSSFLGDSVLQAPFVARGTERTSRADNEHFSRDNYGHCAMSASHVRDNVALEIGSVDPGFELAVPPLGAGENFADVYDIVFILDTREQIRSRIHTQLEKFVGSLVTQFKIKVEKRLLPVGDALWIARHRQQNEEYVLEFVVERKNVSDLWGSIKDNRYKQQKLRLMNCGLKCLLYLVEGDVNRVESTEALKTAMFTTELQGGFRVLRTDDESETCKQYGRLTEAITKRYNLETGKEGKSGQVSKTYNAFLGHCKEVAKDRVKDIFCRQLTQIGQVTEEIACSIQERYPTLLSIAKAFKKLEGNQEAQEKMLQGISIGNTSKTISAAMSRSVYKAIWAP